MSVASVEEGTGVTILLLARVKVNREDSEPFCGVGIHADDSIHVQEIVGDALLPWSLEAWRTVCIR